MRTVRDMQCFALMGPMPFKTASLRFLRAKSRTPRSRAYKWLKMREIPENLTNNMQLCLARGLKKTPHDVRIKMI
ncbi:MAG: hypothetical protein E7317_03015 [Clostridiales bacterium]|nr:hypothetical protein [Clostridiales bacterium]